MHLNGSDVAPAIVDEDYAWAPCDEHGIVQSEYAAAADEETARREAAGRPYGGMVRRVVDGQDTYDYGGGYRADEAAAVAAVDAPLSPWMGPSGSDPHGPADGED